MKYFLFSLIALLVLYFLFTIIYPPIFDGNKNQVIQHPPYKVSEKAQQLFNSLDFVADLHSDALLWRRDLTQKNESGHVDFVRMQEGSVAFQNFTIVSKSPKGQNFDQNSADAFDMLIPLSIGQGQKISTWFSLLNRCIYQCKKLAKFADKFNEEFVIIKSKRDLNRLLKLRRSNKNVVGGMLGIEGGHCLEGKIENFDKVYEAGVRMFGPAHFFDNELGGSAHGTEKGGLTKFGFEVLKKMEEKQMIMDIAHSSEKAIDDIFANYNGPIWTSHSGVYGVYNSGRNLSDKHLKALAAKGGLVGVAFFEGCLGLGEVNVSKIVETMQYIKNLVGVEHIALGSDFDGSVITPFDITGLNLLVEEMLNQNFTETEIKAIMGENVKNFLLKHLP